MEEISICVKSDLEYQLYTTWNNGYRMK